MHMLQVILNVLELINEDMKSDLDQMLCAEGDPVSTIWISCLLAVIRHRLIS